MNTDKVNRWLTLGANLGVLVGIVLILIELNQNADLMKAQITQARANQLGTLYDTIIHSDYWPEIEAKRYAANSDDEWIELLTPAELVRVQYRYFRDFDDIRNQYYQYQEGYLPKRVWDSSTRAQIVRMMRLAAALDRKWISVDAEREFKSAIFRIATEEGLPTPNEDGVWE